MEVLEGYDFVALNFDDDGKLINGAALEELKGKAKSATDAIFLAHGFRNSENEARQLYSGFLKNFRANLARPELASLAARQFVVAGVFWPSKSLPESSADRVKGNVQSAGDDGAVKREEAKQARQQLEDLRDTVATQAQKPRIERAIQLLNRLEDDTAAQDEFAACVKSLLESISLEANEGLEKFKSQEGSEALSRLEAPVILPVSSTGGGNVNSLDLDIGGGGDSGEAQGLLDAVGSVFGAAARFVNMTTWYIMKSRCGQVGANGTAAAVRSVLAANPAIRIQLTGHSLGGRLMAAAAKSLDTGMVASLNLLEAAFSHYGFSKSPKGAAGFFCDVLKKNVVKGPIIATYSDSDSVVGLAYSLASRLAGDNTRAVGDANDEYGGIGRNGTQLLDTAKVEALHRPGTPYTFGVGGVVTNLNGSKGLIQSHGDVTNPAVTYAVASAIAAT
jgi:hypothetical protein